jgi:autophagy-related protein 11
MKIVEDSSSMHSTIGERYGEMDVITKCLDAAISNVELSVKQIEPRYNEMKNWLGPALAEHEQLVNNMEQYLTIARNIPISAGMTKFMTSRDIAVDEEVTLEDLIGNGHRKEGWAISARGFTQVHHQGQRPRRVS